MEDRECEKTIQREEKRTQRERKLSLGPEHQHSFRERNPIMNMDEIKIAQN